MPAMPPPPPPPRARVLPSPFSFRGVIWHRYGGTLPHARFDCRPDNGHARVTLYPRQPCQNLQVYDTIEAFLETMRVPWQALPMPSPRADPGVLDFGAYAEVCPVPPWPWPPAKPDV
jgi:hypothetical protein